LKGDISGSYALGLERTPPLTFVGTGIFSTDGLEVSSQEIATDRFSFEPRRPAGALEPALGDEGGGGVLAAGLVTATPAWTGWPEVETF